MLYSGEWIAKVYAIAEEAGIYITFDIEDQSSFDSTEEALNDGYIIGGQISYPEEFRDGFAVYQDTDEFTTEIELYDEIKDMRASLTEDSLVQAADNMLKVMDEYFGFRNKYERDIILGSPNGTDLLEIQQQVPITKELEDITHYTHDNYQEEESLNRDYLGYTLDCYENNPSLFFDVIRGDSSIIRSDSGDGYTLEFHDNREVPSKELSILSLPDEEPTDPDYYSDVYHRLNQMFEETYHFVPKVLPQLECGLTRLYGRDISDEVLQNFTDNFNRKAVALVKDTYNPTLITLAAMDKINPANITKEQKDILTTYMTTLDIKDYYKIGDVLNQSAKTAKLNDYINVVEHADIAAKYLASIIGHDVTFTEISQEIDNKWMEREKEKFEEKYGYNFADNKVEIEGADKVVEMNGLRAYILPADDLRNYTVGYDTECCQHYGDAGESCVVAATTRPNAGIFVIEKGDKIEAQGFVWASGRADDNGNFVIDSLAFDNIEFANDQNLNRHELVMQAYNEGVTPNEYKTIKKTMDYEGILAAYVKELPYPNVYMGTGYNVMSNIGEPFKDTNRGEDAFLATNQMVKEAIGNTYTDFDDNARTLKLNGEMCMEMQKEIELKDGQYISNGNDEVYEVSSVEELFEEVEKESDRDIEDVLSAFQERCDKQPDTERTSIEEEVR